MKLNIFEGCGHWYRWLYHERCRIRRTEKAINCIMQGETYIQPSLVPALNSRLVSRDIDKGKINSLTNRELEVLIEVANGMFNKEIATSLNISERTVKIIYLISLKN